MATRSTYECFACKKGGFENVRVFLDGKTEDGKTIYKNEDMTPHQHHLKEQQQLKVTNAELAQSLKSLHEKIDRISAIFIRSNENLK
jgi:bifunctional ADP-heptose synthase (sugar kinase/adenylyltransferase)